MCDKKNLIIMSVLRSLNKLLTCSSSLIKNNPYKGYVQLFFKRNVNISARCKLKSNIISENTLPPESFRFTDYDCIGFDLDNTICRYKVGAMMKMEYEVLSSYMVEKKGYPSRHLYLPLEDNEDFILKGLILDLEKGNLLRIASDGRIVHASHGTKHMSDSELAKTYGNPGHWYITDQFAKDPLITWNGPLSEKMRTLLDYFDMPAGLVFARIVDTLDEIAGKQCDKYNIWPDLLSGLVYMFDRNNFNLGGGYFQKMQDDPNKYINKCDEKIIQWLKDLRARNKVLFLITGSHIDYASFIARYSIGSEWKELFDSVIFFAKKPGFFTGDRPFITLNGCEDGEAVSSSDLKTNILYSQGNWKDLGSLLARATNKVHPRVAYVGDNIIQDIYAPAQYTSCDTVAVVEELQAEGVYGFDRCHSDHTSLISATWGSFFSHNKMGATDSIWRDILRRYSKLIIPSIEFLASHPVDHRFKTF